MRRLAGGLFSALDAAQKLWAAARWFGWDLREHLAVKAVVDGYGRQNASIVYVHAKHGGPPTHVILSIDDFDVVTWKQPIQDVAHGHLEAMR